MSDPSLIKVFAVCSRVAKDPNILRADSEASDRTGWMPRLICVFAGRICHFVGFDVLWLKLFEILSQIIAVRPKQIIVLPISWQNFHAVVGQKLFLFTLGKWERLEIQSKIEKCCPVLIKTSRAGGF